MITLKEIQKNESIQALVHAGNRYLAAMGYTDHGPRHVGYVSKTASYLLRELGYSDREIELAAIAGWVHDVATGVKASITAGDWLAMALVCFILPAVLSCLFGMLCRKLGWIREGDLRLE